MRIPDITGEAQFGRIWLPFKLQYVICLLAPDNLACRLITGDCMQADKLLLAEMGCSADKLLLAEMGFLSKHTAAFLQWSTAQSSGASTYIMLEAVASCYSQINSVLVYLVWLKVTPAEMRG